MMILSYLLIIEFLCTIHILKAEAQSECRATNNRNSQGKYLSISNGKFYTAKTSLIFSELSVAKCTMTFSADSKFLSMNVVEEFDRVKCEMFENSAKENANGEGILIGNGKSTYYEKNDEFIIGFSSIIEVESKDDKPGTFIFRKPTAFYRIKLEHVDGGLVCSSQNHNSPFGCFWGNAPIVGKANDLSLVEHFRGSKVIQDWHFDQFEGVDGFSTSFVATCKCFRLVQGMTYSFWYGDDYNDAIESDNSGKTSFRMLTKLC